MSKRLIRPTPEEDAAINRAIAEDPDTWEMSDEDFAAAARGRENPALAAWLERHAAATLALDPEIVARLKADGPDWEARANAILRRAVGLD